MRAKVQNTDAIASGLQGAIFKMLQKTWDFIWYWYFRYLMVTELYMVERWEQILINSGMMVLFFLLFYFNHTVFLSAVSYVRHSIF